MDQDEIIEWLLEGDVSIQYQTKRDLLGITDQKLQARIAEEGWGKRFLDQRSANGHWGEKFYFPKWKSTHYTLLDLRNLCISPEEERCKETIAMVIREEKSADGGILPIGDMRLSDVCVNGMFLNYASYFKTNAQDLESVVDAILQEKMEDGGFNCMSNRSGAIHSSLHSTLSVLEGLLEFQKNGYDYRKTDVTEAIASSREFILLHQFFLSDRTGKVIREDFLRLSYPHRWYYNILRALDCFQYADFDYDHRMDHALQVIMKKQNKDNTWNLQAKIPGQLHFEMEKAGRASRWNTLLAMRVLKKFKRNIIIE